MGVKTHDRTIENELAAIRNDELIMFSGILWTILTAELSRIMQSNLETFVRVRELCNRKWNWSTHLSFHLLIVGWYIYIASLMLKQGPEAGSRLMFPFWWRFLRVWILHLTLSRCFQVLDALNQSKWRPSKTRGFQRIDLIGWTRGLQGYPHLRVKPDTIWYHGIPCLTLQQLNPKNLSTVKEYNPVRIGWKIISEQWKTN